MSNRNVRGLILAAAAGATLSASVASAQSISTIYSGGNGGASLWTVYFDVTVVNPITISSLDVNVSDAAGTPFTLDVYMTAAGGTYLNNTSNPAVWTLKGSGPGTAAGTTLHSPCDVTDFVVAPGTYGMAIRYNGAAPSYTNGTVANQNYSNPDISLVLGASQATTVGPFNGGTPFTPRVWNGTIYYALGGASGACCKTDGSCIVTNAAGCSSVGGIYRGDGSACATANCPQPPTGACCLFDGSCNVITAAQCASASGTYRGDGVTCAAANCGAPPPVVYSNCNIATGTTTLSGMGGLPAGTQWSECARDETDPTSANTISGFAGSGAFRLADDFVVPAGGLNVAYVRAYAYLTGSTAPNATAATLQIWNGPPNAGGTVIFGDQTTNRLAANQFAPIFRCFNTVTPAVCGGAVTIADQTRHVQYLYLAVNQFLPAGTYWIDFNYIGPAFSPPSVQADAIGRQCDPNNSNALQFNAGWLPLGDTGQGCVLSTVNQDLFFDILGTTGGSSCYANCDGSTTQPCLNVLDFGCFLNKFAASDTYANCDQSTVVPVLNVLDFGCFLNKFAAGCSSC